MPNHVEHSKRWDCHPFSDIDCPVFLQMRPSGSIKIAINWSRLLLRNFGCLKAHVLPPSAIFGLNSRWIIFAYGKVQNFHHSSSGKQLWIYRMILQDVEQHMVISNWCDFFLDLNLGIFGLRNMMPGNPRCHYWQQGKSIPKILFS